jgi:hypothetical protein
MAIYHYPLCEGGAARIRTRNKSEKTRDFAGTHRRVVTKRLPVFASPVGAVREVLGD